MNRNLKKFIFGILALAVVTMYCDSELFKPKEAPIIESISTANNISKVNPGDTVAVIVVATNPEEGALTYSWSATGGELLLPRDQETVSWVSPLAGGRYTIEVTVSNSADKSSKADVEIEVISQAAPSVQILTPADGDFLVQFIDIEISVSAFHVNGLKQVSLFVNDSLETTLPPHTGSNIYNFEYQLNLPGGPNSLRVEAVANNNVPGEDEIVINVEAILPKTNP